ncbi:PTS-dependent dihydroxyacetone kinase, ADP-binding subunit DhaL [Arthrobacter saudimassiliensis]|uniref:PTS-dependent dihydroxyacetone kinase, ADP-binding subunit DhaL n=1 Tax=Arthrobacter saudimassiliensis TaxID=1461584 RepID=A0A078MQI0_9MICC|nr:PTS-dependent dihydroxyacetone kinase, ADP-binding subunit DhaL [Arthrobacter saudimassiliensis]
MAADAAWAVQWMRDSAEVLAANRQRLIDLDREIGDADHGENMDRGFRAVVEKLDAAPEPPAAPSDVLKTAAMTLMSKVGGAAGPLYGTAFLRAATSTGGKAELGGTDVADMVEAALGGLTSRGKAEPGDKTMVDAWTPAAEAARRTAEHGADAAETLAAAAAAAEEGLAATEPLTARKGRASYLGERSAGHLDPGAASTALILRAAARAAGAPE